MLCNGLDWTVRTSAESRSERVPEAIIREKNSASDLDCAGGGGIDEYRLAARSFRAAIRVFGGEERPSWGGSGESMSYQREEAGNDWSERQFSFIGLVANRYRNSRI